MKFPHAARIRGADKNHPDEWLMGYLSERRPGGFKYHVPINSRILTGIASECDVELLDMPIDGAKEEP